MRIEVIGKNGFQPSVANKEYASKKIGKIKTYFSDDVELEARVVCKVYKDCHKVEVTIPSKNLIIRAEASDFDLYAAIDKAVDKLVTQIRKHKERMKIKLDKSSIRYALDKENFDAKELEMEIYAGKVVRSKRVELKPMTLDEALVQLDLLGHAFFIYLDIETNEINVIYKRDDGDYAVIETA